MRRILLFLLCVCSIITLSAQEIVVKKFYKDETAVNTNPCTDDNNMKCALIRVFTTATGLELDNVPCCEIKYKTSEVDIYLSPGTRWMSLRLPRHLPLKDYAFPVPLEAAAVYVMVLETGAKDEPADIPQKNWLRMEVSPAEALVKIDGEPVEVDADGNFKKLMAVGEHKYEAYCNLYHAKEGKFEISTGSKTMLNISLLPNHGYVAVTSTPESGAVVYIDSKRAGVTPFKSGKLECGQHTVQVTKDMYKSAKQDVTVTDGKTIDVAIALQPDFAEPVFTCSDAEAEIWINDEKKGTGKWTGRLAADVYIVKTTKSSHKPIEKSITLKAGDNSTITLAPPTPIYGWINVDSKPDPADIYLDGNKVGSTPELLQNILIGTHELRIEKKGCATVTRTVTVDEGKTAEISVDLPTGETVTLKSNPTGATIYIDGENAGTAPVTKALSYGSHKIKAEKDGVTKEMTVAVKEKGETEWTLDVRKGPQTETITVNGVSFKMIGVEGGTFTMGCTSEQGNDCYDDEKNSHEVTVSDFNIGETEVTQALWKAVMGSNPSNWKGDNLPVENVSWNDCQEFIKKLNALTGREFRLPTEAEWEYAARGGNKSKGYKYSGSNTIGDVAWYWENSESKTHAVKGKRANELGLYDMTGNVWEWCGDRYGSYSGSSQTDPAGPSSGSYRVYRGGGWNGDASSCRVANGYLNAPGDRDSDLGFRVVLLR